MLLLFLSGLVGLRFMVQDSGFIEIQVFGFKVWGFR